jgi:glutaredoxin 3
MYCTHSCPYCQMAVRLLGKKGIDISSIHVDEQPEKRKEMIDRTGRHTVPQIFIGEQHVGGYMELAELDMDGELDVLLNE